MSTGSKRKSAMVELEALLEDDEDRLRVLLLRTDHDPSAALSRREQTGSRLPFHKRIGT